MRTWIPWKPVAKKNTLPYTESAIEYRVSLYSHHWRKVKYPPNKIVNIILIWSRELKIREWWNHVTVVPDLNKIIVLRMGIWKGLRVLIPDGGHIKPLSSRGFKLLWKKVQKKALKNSTSEKIKRIIPSLRPVWT